MRGIASGLACFQVGPYEMVRVLAGLRQFSGFVIAMPMRDGRSRTPGLFVMQRSVPA